MRSQQFLRSDHSHFLELIRHNKSSSCLFFDWRMKKLLLGIGEKFQNYITGCLPSNILVMFSNGTIVWILRVQCFLIHLKFNCFLSLCKHSVNFGFSLHVAVKNVTTISFSTFCHRKFRQKIVKYGITVASYSFSPFITLCCFCSNTQLLLCMVREIKHVIKTSLLWNIVHI